ncbi:acyl carrier protein [Streptomyces sp. AV19]|uniref:acyl carrier protein n=1 Tax=Streptomyces sp. AV19 TaxID=2793068 RepID=UPI0018FE287C|nr:acyl carrier protein [Streptomyces sp. AV19]MBH1938808.1 acyl carrier protein [Streptomyces sp. AV19]MDG4534741.1 acyl carrier protein [Streptomyces sp. AV19]
MAAVVDIDDLRAIVAGSLELEPGDVADDAHFTDDLEMDSLALLEVSSRVEKRYGVAVRDAALGSLRTLADLRILIESLLAEGSAA